MRNEVYRQNLPSGEPIGIMPYALPMPGATAAGGDSLSRIIWDGRWLILISLVLAGAGAYVYLRLVEPKYESTSRVLVEKLGRADDRSTPVDLGAASQDFVQTQAVLMTSQAVVAQTMQDPNVLSLPTFQDEDYVRDLVGSLSATGGKSGDIIHLSASSPHSEDASTIVNAVVRSYIQWHRENRQLSARDLHKDLSRQLDSCRLQLRAKRQEAMTYEQRHPEVAESTRGGILSQTLDLLKQELATTRMLVTERESYCRGLEQYQSDPNKFRQYVYSSPLFAVVQEDTQRTAVESEILEVERQLEQVEAGMVAAQKPAIVFLRNRKTKLEERLGGFDAEFIRNHIALAQARAEDSVAREQRLAKLYQGEFEEIQRAAGQNSEYAMIIGECEMLENLCNTLLKQINDLDLNSQGGLNIHVLQWASPADKPSSPQVARVIGIALVLGIMAGAGLSVVRDWTDQRVRSADEITAILGVPILGSVPSMPRRHLSRAHRLRFTSNSYGSEAYRAIRTALLYGTPREQAVTILVTSPGPLEGKTTLVSNLALAMACAGQRTLIIDADLRKPMQHRIFAMNERGLGLSDILVGRCSIDEAVRSTEVACLDVLPSGHDVGNPSELLNSPAFVELLDQLKRKYDRILVDSPPVGVVTDAQILSTACGLTLLVLRAQKTSRLLTQRAADALRTVGARVAGAVVNDVRKRDTRYHRYGASNYPLTTPALKGSGPIEEEPCGEQTPRPEDAPAAPAEQKDAE